MVKETKLFHTAFYRTDLSESDARRILNAEPPE
jgi:hypothetical protein